MVASLNSDYAMPQIPLSKSTAIDEKHPVLQYDMLEFLKPSQI
jgi:hypothetical protein